MPLIITYKCLKCGELQQSTDGNVPTHCNTVCVRDTPLVTLNVVNQTVGAMSALLYDLSKTVQRIEKKIDRLDKKKDKSK